jgi:hypothetical protein
MSLIRSRTRSWSHSVDAAVSHSPHNNSSFASIAERQQTVIVRQGPLCIGLALLLVVPMREFAFVCLPMYMWCCPIYEFGSGCISLYPHILLYSHVAHTVSRAFYLSLSLSHSLTLVCLCIAHSNSQFHGNNCGKAPMAARSEGWWCLDSIPTDGA